MADRSRLTANLAAAGLLLALGGGALAWQRPWEATTSDSPAEIPAESRSLLIGQFQALSSARAKADFVQAAGRSAAARRVGADIWDARRELGVDDVAFAYRRGGQAADRADGTTSAVVDVSWDGGSSSVRIRLMPRAGGFDLVSASNSGKKPLPVWLAGPVDITQATGVRLIRIGGADDGDARDIDAIALAQAAVRTARAVLPTAGERLTVVLPASERSAAAVLGRHPRDVTQVAAVSATLGGSTGDPAIVVNPELFADMDARAQRVVMAHEATHVLSGVVGRDVKLWVAEGFADYVALRDDRAPLSVSAGQILRSVRTDGAPKTLPTEEQFDESAHGLSTVYESAWMAFRMLGERFGDEAVRAFYADVVAGQAVSTAVQQRFGLSMGALTTQWRDYLTKSASTVS